MKIRELIEGLQDFVKACPEVSGADFLTEGTDGWSGDVVLSVRPDGRVLLRADRGDRPGWTREDLSKLVWAEDDATVSQDDHVGLTEAAVRLLGAAKYSDVVSRWESGDTVYKLLSTSHVLVESYRGNCQIRKLKRRG